MILYYDDQKLENYVFDIFGIPSPKPKDLGLLGPGARSSFHMMPNEVFLEWLGVV
jgi:hypothetical protein